MNCFSSDIMLVPMSPHMLVRQGPDGVVLCARQVVDVMNFAGLEARVGDWIVACCDMDFAEDDDFMLVRQGEFDRSWEIVGRDPAGEVPC